jgi:hypothetical protein
MKLVVSLRAAAVADWLRPALGRRLHAGQASARMAARPNPAADQGRTPSRRMTNYR